MTRARRAGRRATARSLREASAVSPSALAIAAIRTAARCRGSAGRRAAAAPRSGGRGRRRKCAPRRCARRRSCSAAPMSDGRTMPAMVRIRSSALTRTSCEPLIIRLPLGSTSVTTAATDSSMFSERVGRAVAFGVGLRIDVAVGAAAGADAVPFEVERAAERCGLAVRLRSDSFLKLGAVVDRDQHGQDVAGRQRARIGEQPALAVVPERKALDRRRRLLGIVVDGGASAVEARRRPATAPAHGRSP